MLIIEDAEIEAGSSGVVLNERLREWVTDNVIDLVGLFDMRESLQSDVGDASDARSSDGQSTALGLSGNGGGHDATRTVDNGAGDPETVQTRWILLICLLKLHLVLQKERRFEPVVREQTKPVAVVYRQLVRRIADRQVSIPIDNRSHNRASILADSD